MVGSGLLHCNPLYADAARYCYGIIAYIGLLMYHHRSDLELFQDLFGMRSASKLHRSANLN